MNSSISSSYLSPLTGKIIPLSMYGASAFEHIERGQGQLALDTLAKVMPIYETVGFAPHLPGLGAPLTQL